MHRISREIDRTSLSLLRQQTATKTGLPSIKHLRIQCREIEGTRSEGVRAGNRTVDSNPTLSVKI